MLPRGDRRAWTEFWSACAAARQKGRAAIVLLLLKCLVPLALSAAVIAAFVVLRR